MDKKYIAYYRVSTARQGKSGLGLAAQQQAVSEFINGNGSRLIQEYTEVETGKNNDRPKLTEALHMCKITGAILVIAKLDRLSRNAAFLLTLRDSGVRFVAADMPDANNLTVGLLAVIAEHEREMISKRTKEALAAAKARGVKLGNPNGAKHLMGRGNKEAVTALKRKAQDKANDLKVVIENIQKQGFTSFGQIAKELSERGIATPRGGSNWHAMTVKRVMDRL
ncbi:recombinase family protein [Emcibacter sp.]|uniref:recombinase family protein n=1 Tax=Emcibacter sp. TaxID=1979954 RepID=UPI002AA94554|nr:recombinase family protein [Emcibacter sp.]